LAKAGDFPTAGLQRTNDTAHCSRNLCDNYMLCSLLGKEKGRAEICFIYRGLENLLYKRYPITSHIGAWARDRGKLFTEFCKKSKCNLI